MIIITITIIFHAAVNNLAVSQILIFLLFHRAGGHLNSPRFYKIKRCHCLTMNISLL